MKNYALVYAAIVAFALTFAACSGDAGNDGSVEQVVDPVQTGGDNVVDPVNDPDNVKPVDDPSDPVKDPVEDPVNDPTDIIDYPEPGTVEYWLDIIPGTWEQTNPLNGKAKCLSPESPDTCDPQLEIYDFSTGEYTPEESGCAPGTKYLILGALGASGGLCMDGEGTVSACQNDICDSFGTYIAAQGTIVEKTISEGTCSQKADGMPSKCLRHSDCAGIIPDATCNDMQVEYWIEFCEWSSGQGSCDQGVHYSYLKTK